MAKGEDERPKKTPRERLRESLERNAERIEKEWTPRMRSAISTAQALHGSRGAEARAKNEDEQPQVELVDYGKGLMAEANTSCTLTKYELDTFVVAVAEKAGVTIDEVYACAEDEEEGYPPQLSVWVWVKQEGE